MFKHDLVLFIKIKEDNKFHTNENVVRYYWVGEDKFWVGDCLYGLPMATCLAQVNDLIS